MKLIQEVNKVKKYQDYLSDSQDSISENPVKTKARLVPETRARQVPSIQDLPVFKRNFFKRSDQIL